MPEQQKNNPLHGVRLDAMLDALVKHYGWKNLGLIIVIKCFNENPTMSSSLKFLRTTPWARKKVEDLYLELSTE
ncbi:VF530 family protein [soil metagenome]